MRKSYKELAEESRNLGGRAPRFDVKYFTREEVRSALVNNRYFTRVCIELGLLENGSKSPFNAIRNLHRLLAHFRLKTSMLGRDTKEQRNITCPHCKMKFKMPKIKWDVQR